MRILALSTIPFLFGSLACSDGGEASSEQDPAIGVPAIDPVRDEQVVQAAESAENPSDMALPSDVDQAGSNSEATPELSATDLAAQEPGIQGEAGPVGAQADGEVLGTESADAPEQEEPPAVVTVSAGCGNVSPPTQGLSIGANGQQADYAVTLPPGYDPNVATPMVFAFRVSRARSHSRAIP